MSLKYYILGLIVFLLAFGIAMFFWGKSSISMSKPTTVQAEINIDSLKHVWLEGTVDSVTLKTLLSNKDNASKRILERLRAQYGDNLREIWDSLMNRSIAIYGVDTTQETGAMAKVIVNEDTLYHPISVKVRNRVSFVGEPLNLFREITTFVYPINLQLSIPLRPSIRKDELLFWILPEASLQGWSLGIGAMMGYKEFGIGINLRKTYPPEYRIGYLLVL